MIHGVFFNDENDNIKHVIVFDIEETLTESEITEEAAKNLNLEFPLDTKYVDIWKAKDTATDEIWVRIKDGCLIQESDFDDEDDDGL